MPESPPTSAPTQLALVIHFHQPVGNLDAVVARATDRCYRPFLRTLTEFPDVRMTLHLSGCLLEWLESEATDVPEMLEELVDRDQIELMTGGFYEPILAALPRVDQLGQIQRLTAHLQDRYRAQPSGLWLAERVWEQDVVQSISEAGAAYTVVDDTMFHSVGISDERLTGAYVTDHEGHTLLVYAGDRNLRYLIPYKKVGRVMEHLESTEPGRLYVYADDGEKFGEWPDTYERVHGKGWLHDFFTALSDPESVELVRLGDHAATNAPVGRVYLPSSSYDEMMTWALPTEARLKVGALRRSLQKDDPEGALPFVQGAPWRAFLAKYPEVNQLQKRMQFVSNEVHRAGADPDAIRELYRAQCNCSYWHGSFGGVYLGFMRSALWHHLMRAEAHVERAGGYRVEEIDLDADTRPELVIEGPWGLAVASPERGGQLLEFDDWTIGANLLAVMSRHREAYHLADENPSDDDDEDEEEMRAIQARTEMGREPPTFDEQQRGALTDHLDGRRVTQPYEHRIEDGAAIMSTQLDGTTIEKTLRPDDEGLKVNYQLTAAGGHEGSFTMESSVLPLNLGREVEPAKVETRSDGWIVSQSEGEVGLAASFDRPAEVTHEPLETGSATLEGLQTMHQGTSVRTTWELRLRPGERFEVGLHLRPVANPDASKTERGVSA
ncbi:MAG: DUF1925 domain-containing protein [Actinobacteria bacterium]|nr:DUF1925 domain-containing protein [Actinomycetota bacterium]